MAAALLGRSFTADKLDALFEETAQQQYTQDLLFSTVFGLMSNVVCAIEPSINAAYQASSDEIDVSITSVYNKLNALEPSVSAAMLRHSARATAPIVEELGAELPPLLPGFSAKIVDGTCIEATEHIHIYRDGRDVANSLVRSYDALTDEKLTHLRTSEMHLGRHQGDGRHVPWWMAEGREEDLPEKLALCAGHIDVEIYDTPLPRGFFTTRRGGELAGPITTLRGFRERPATARASHTGAFWPLEPSTAFQHRLARAHPGLPLGNTKSAAPAKSRPPNEWPEVNWSATDICNERTISDMASVLLLSSAHSNNPSRPYPYDELDRMKRSAACDKFGVHHRTKNPEQADVILFVENCDTIRHYFEARKHPCLRAHREKCFLYSKHDYPVPFLSGVYPSIEKRWYDVQRTRSGGYLKAFGHSFIECDPNCEEHDYLYSFSGSVTTHPVRKEMLALEYENQFLLDTSQFWPYDELEETQKEKLEQRYVKTSQRSKFILCPRGRGVSSIRLFESMRMGRAPVIIADEWVPPKGPDWNAFSLRIAEDDISSVPRILEKHEEQTLEMGRLARKVWENYFSVDAFFHHTVEQCLDIKRARRRPVGVLPFFQVLRQLVQPLHARTLARELIPTEVVQQLRQLRG